MPSASMKRSYGICGRLNVPRPAFSPAFGSCQWTWSGVSCMSPGSTPGSRPSGGPAATPRQILAHEVRRQRDARVVLGRILELLEIVQPAVLVDPVGAGYQPRRQLRIAVEMLMDRAGRDVDDVARLPLVTLDLVLRLPAIVVGDLDVAVLVQVVAETFQHVEAFLGEVAVAARTA